MHVGSVNHLHVQPVASSLFAKLLPPMYATPEARSHMPLCHDLQPVVLPPQEELWKSLFSEPDMWYDKRPAVNNRPNFVHKQHHFSLWLNVAPEWVAKGIADADSAVKALWEKVCQCFFCACPWKAMLLLSLLLLLILLLWLVCPCVINAMT